MKKDRVLLVDDHELFRQGLVSLINGQPDLEVVGQAGDGFEALQLARRLRPDLIVMDVTMPVCDGVEATRLIRQVDELAQVRILMLTILDDEQKLLDAVEAGANGYLLKGSSQDEFLRAVQGILKGEASVPPKLAARLLEEYARLANRPASAPAANGSDLPDLTPREQEVLCLIASQLTDKEIAADLSLSLHTVKSHVRNILGKLHAVNRRQAVIRARLQGLLPDD